MKYALTGAKVFNGEHLAENVAVIVEEGYIKDIIETDRLCAGLLSPPYEEIELEEGILAPGFIDLQVNGGGGVLLNNQPTIEGITAMLEGHRRLGTTAMMPTLISDSLSVHQQAVESIIQARETGLNGVLGVHVEGPCFNPLRRGAHKEAMIRAYDAQDLAWFNSLRGLNVMVTLAPECVPQGYIRELTKMGIRVFAGHSNATYEEVQAGLKEGLCGFTHLFNAMSPLTSREPGVVGAALTAPDAWAGIIADGYHVHPASVQVAWRAMPRGQMFLVSDAMATVGSSTDRFMLYDEEIRESQGRLINREGALAGSAIGMIDAVRNMIESVGVPLTEALKMASLYPARFLKLDHLLGYIKTDYRADLVHFTKDYKVNHTWVAGEHQAY